MQILKVELGATGETRQAGSTHWVTSGLADSLFMQNWIIVAINEHEQRAPLQTFSNPIQRKQFFNFFLIFHFLPVDPLQCHIYGAFKWTLGFTVNNTERHTQLIEQEVGKFETVLYELV